MRTILFALIGFVIYATLRILLYQWGPGFLIDDAYITLRYVQNMVDHGSLTYHVGENIFGISTILYPMLLGLIKLLLPFLDLTEVDVGLNIGLEYLCILVLIRLFTLLNVTVPFSIGLAIATLWNPLLFSASQGGMETPLFVLWLVLTMVTVDTSMPLAASFAGLALMTRPEGSIAVGIVGMMSLLRRGPWSTYLILGGFVAAFGAFYLLGYHTLYPASVEIKHLISSKDPLYAFIYFMKAPALLIPLGSIPWPISVVIVYGVAAYGIFKWPDRTGALAFAICAILLNFALYSVANPPVWYWYPAPMVTLIGILFFFGIYQMLKDIPLLLPLVLLAWIALEVRWTYFTPGTLLDVYTHRVKAYHESVTKLQNEYGLTPSQSIFTHEIGAVGYFSKAHIYDAVGLINPSLAHFGIVREVTQGVTYGLATKAFLVETKPDFIILQENLFAPDIAQWNDFKTQYRLLFELPDTAIDQHSGDIQVYKKNP